MKEITYPGNNNNGAKKRQEKTISILSRKNTNNDGIISEHNRDNIKKAITQNYAIFGNSDHVFGLIYGFSIEDRKIKFDKKGINFCLYRNNTIEYNKSYIKNESYIEIGKDAFNKNIKLYCDSTSSDHNISYYDETCCTFSKKDANIFAFFEGIKTIIENSGSETLESNFAVKGENEFIIEYPSYGDIHHYSILLLFPHTKSVPLMRLYRSLVDDVDITNILDVYNKEDVEYNSIYSKFDASTVATKIISDQKNITSMPATQKVNDVMQYLKHENIITDKDGSVLNYKNDIGLHKEFLNEQNYYIYFNNDIVGGIKYSTHKDGSPSIIIRQNDCIFDYNKNISYDYTDGCEISVLPDDIAELNNTVVAGIIKELYPTNFEYFEVKNNHYVIKAKSVGYDKGYNKNIIIDIYNDFFMIRISSMQCATIHKSIYKYDGTRLIDLEFIETKIDDNNTRYRTIYEDINGLKFSKYYTVSNISNSIIDFAYSAPEIYFQYHQNDDGNIIVDQFISSLFSLSDKYIYIRDDEFGIPEKVQINK